MYVPLAVKTVLSSWWGCFLERPGMQNQAGIDAVKLLPSVIAISGKIIGVFKT